MLSEMRDDAGRSRLPDDDCGIVVVILYERIERRAEVVLPKGRTPRDVWLEAPVAVSFAECREDEAPVAARAVRYEDEKGVRFDMRVRDGLLWAEARPASADETDLSAILRGLVFDHLRAIDSFCWGRERGADDDHVRPWGKGERIGELAGTVQPSVLRDGLPTLRAVLQAWADREILVVGGVAHVRVRSPRLTVEQIFPRRIREALPERLAKTFPEHGIVPWTDDGEARAIATGPILAWLSDPGRAEGLGLVGDLEEARSHLAAYASEVLRPDLLAQARGRGVENIDLVGDYEGLNGLLSGDADRKFRAALLAAEAETAASKGERPEELLRRLDRMRLLGRRWSVERKGRVDVTDPAPDTGGPTATVALPFVRTNGEDGWYGKGGHADPVEIDHEVPMVDAGSLSVACRTGSRGREILRGADGEWYLSMDPALKCGWLRENGAGWLVSLPRRDAVMEARSFVTEAMALAGERDPRAWRTIERAVGSGRDASHPGDPPSEGRRLAALADFARHRLVVDGTRLLLRVPEPTVAIVHEDRLGWRMHLDVSWRHGMENVVEKILHPRFRLDEAEEAEAAFSSIRTYRQPVDAPIVEAVDLSGLAFDSASWNLKTAFLGILERADGRMSTLPPELVVATARIRGEMEFEAGPRWGVKLDYGFYDVDPVPDVLRILDVLDDAFYDDDAGAAVLRTIARRSATALLDRRSAKEEVRGDDGWSKGFTL